MTISGITNGDTYDTVFRANLAGPLADGRSASQTAGVPPPMKNLPAEIRRRDVRRRISRNVQIACGDRTSWWKLIHR